MIFMPRRTISNRRLWRFKIRYDCVLLKKNIFGYQLVYLTIVTQKLHHCIQYRFVLED